MLCLFGFMCAIALGVMPMLGCSETSGDGGGSSGVACEDNLCPCTEDGIRAAIATGGGPFTFDCDGPTTVPIGATITIDNDLILDGQGNLTIDGNGKRVLFVDRGVEAELRRLTMAEGFLFFGDDFGAGIYNSGTLTLDDCTVSNNSAHSCAGIYNEGVLTLTNSTVSLNSAEGSGGLCNDGTMTLTNSLVFRNQAANFGSAGGIYNDGVLTLINSTVSENGAESQAGGIYNEGTLALTNSTVYGNLASGRGDAISNFGTLTLTSSLVEGNCEGGITSNGYNIESPGNTCGFDQQTDQTDVTVDDLNLGPLADNGGPTQTHALLPGSVAIDVIPLAMCEVDEDQRGVTRPQGATCDVGAFELQASE